MPFTDDPWDGPEAEASMSPEEFCTCCLIDTNPSGQDKIKANCKLPVRKTPGAPYNKNALRNAAARIFQLTGVGAEDKRKAAAHLVRLMAEAGIDAGESVLRMAGKRGK